MLKGPIGGGDVQIVTTPQMLMVDHLDGRPNIRLAGIEGISEQSAGSWTTSRIEVIHPGGPTSFQVRGDRHDALIAELLNCVEEAKGAVTYPPGPSSSTSLADELAKLAALRRDGAITDAEFAAAKDRLLHG
jgi:hypothetical protein